MSDFSDDLLRASAKLHSRRTGQKGPLKNAYVRRSISTTYYALFHFLLDEAGSKIVGAHHELRQRRRLFSRTFTHRGLTTAFGKLKGQTIEASAADLFRRPNTPVGPITTPAFVQQMAKAYLDAKSKREDADYNLNEPLSETDACQLRRRIRRAIKEWKSANTPDDRDFKHAAALLLSLKGQIKNSENY